MMADDFEGPNGLAFSPDERLLYVSESGRQFAQTPSSISVSSTFSMTESACRRAALSQGHARLH